jgi:hypothetical protein
MHCKTLVLANPGRLAGPQVHAPRARGPHGWQAQATAVRVTHTHPLAVMEPRASARCRKRRPVNRRRYPSPRHIQQDAHRPARSRTNSANRPDRIQPSSPGKRRIQGHQISFADRRVKDRRKFSGDVAQNLAIRGGMGG